MNIQLGNQLTFQIENDQIIATVISIREVAWDSFNPNFFVIFPTGILESYQSSFMTSFHQAKSEISFLTKLVKLFPMITLIDIESIINEIKSFISLLSIVLQYLFAFTLIMGLILIIIGLFIHYG